MLYRYVQLDERGQWVTIPDSPDYEKIARDMGAVRMTALALSEQITDETDPEKVKYKGPLYFDIDNSDLAMSISSTKELIGKLQELEVPEEAIQVYCSGNKGFHVFVPEKVFQERASAQKRLPEIYMEMARDLYVYGLDFAVYSGGKGRMFRPENGRHESKGTYRVRISLQELEEMTPEIYRGMVTAPRTAEFKKLNGTKSYPLRAVYERCKQRVFKKQKLKSSALPVEELKPYAEEPPACINELMLPKHKIAFNSAGLQLATFIARSGTPKYRVDSLVDQMSTARQSTTYDTPRKRREHLRGLVNYVQAKSGVNFSCAAMRSLVTRNPCKDCPLKEKGLGERGAEDMPAVLARHDGYYVAGKEEDRRVSTFTLHPVEVFMDQPQGRGSARRIGTTMQLQSHNEVLGRVYFEETGWRSKSELLKQVEGIGNLGFLGNDQDVQKIKIAVYAAGEEGEVEEITQVHSAGIMETAVNRSGKRVYTYVEPGLSVNSYGIQGTHEMHGKVSPEPRLRKTDKPQPGDQNLRQTLLGMLSMNSPVIMAQLSGWHSACHLKAHIMNSYDQFPSLNLWGNAGSGKSMTSALMACLNGVDYNQGGGSPLSLSMTTAWPLVEEVSSTTTIPKILEEFNRSKIKKYGMYEHCVEIIKAGWNGHPVSRGRLARSSANGRGKGGGETVDFRVSAPLVVCSEQAPQEPALQQRMVQVHLTNESRKGRAQYFMDTMRNRKQLLSFSRAMTMTALKTKEEWIEEHLEAGYGLVSETMNDRSRFSYALLFAGLDYFNAVAHSLSIPFDEEIEELKKALSDHLSDNRAEIERSKIWSEVDQMLGHLADMAQLSLQDNGLSPLQPGRHFLAVERSDELILDMQVIFPLLRMWSQRTDTPIVFSSFRQLVPLLQAESYYVTDDRRERDISANRPVWVLRLSEMKRRGHSVEMFMD